MGDSISRLLAATGWQVSREFYYNDAGAQIHNLALSVQARCKGVAPEDPAWPADGYRGDYIAELAQAYLRGEAVAAQDRQVILRGANVNSLGDYYQGDPDAVPVVPVTDADWADMAAHGFNVVRLLVSWSKLEPDDGNDAQDHRGFFGYDPHNDVFVLFQSTKPDRLRTFSLATGKWTTAEIKGDAPPAAKSRFQGYYDPDRNVVVCCQGLSVWVYRLSQGHPRK